MARVVVTGGAGFIGSHLCRALLARGDSVVCVDNFLTGRRENVEELETNDAFELVVVDVSKGLPVEGHVDGVIHLASPASPPEYLRMPFETMDVATYGTRHSLDLALAHDARFVLASTSEVYGDPQIHPQHESYWGNVNPNGPRSVYDEGKRFAETLTMAYQRYHDLNVGIIRTFNTYGPFLRPADGRVVSNFLVQAMRNEPITVYGDGTQTRSFCYVDDQVAGYIAMLDSDATGPINIGNPGEFTIRELADIVRALTGSTSPVVHAPLPADDPTRRQPDISRAREILAWAPTIDLREGLRRTYAWYLEEDARGRL